MPSSYGYCGTSKHCQLFLLVQAALKMAQMESHLRCHRLPDRLRSERDRRLQFDAPRRNLLLQHQNDQQSNCRRLVLDRGREWTCTNLAPAKPQQRYRLDERQKIVKLRRGYASDRGMAQYAGCRRWPFATQIGRKHSVAERRSVSS